MSTRESNKPVLEEMRKGIDELRQDKDASNGVEDSSKGTLDKPAENSSSSRPKGNPYRDAKGRFCSKENDMGIGFHNFRDFIRIKSPGPWLGFFKGHGDWCWTWPGNESVAPDDKGFWRCEYCSSKYNKGISHHWDSFQKADAEIEP